MNVDQNFFRQNVLFIFIDGHERGFFSITSIYFLANNYYFLSKKEKLRVKHLNICVTRNFLDENPKLGFQT